LSRLVVFGCSFTLGSCLPDNNGFDKQPSKFAWPSLLAEKLNREVVNNGIPGNNNLHILTELLKFDFKSDDVVVILWSLFARELLSDFDIVNNDLKKLWVMLQHDSGIKHKNWLYVNHAHLFLKSKNVKVLQAHTDFEGIVLPIPEILSTIDMPDVIYNVRKHFIDLALDNQHPGVESHKLIAQSFYEKLTNVIY